MMDRRVLDDSVDTSSIVDNIGNRGAIILNNIDDLIGKTVFARGEVGLVAALRELDRIQASILDACSKGFLDPRFRERVRNDSPPKRPGYASYVIYKRPSLVVRLNFWESAYISFLETIPTVHTHNWHMVSIPVVGGLLNMEFRIHSSAKGRYLRYVEVGGFGTGCKKLLGVCCCEPLGKTIVPMGVPYTVAKGAYHAVVPEKPYTVTICVQFSKEPKDRFLCLNEEVQVDRYLAQTPLSDEDLTDLGKLLNLVPGGNRT